MLKKFGLEDSKPIKTPMSSDTKLTQNEEGESVDDTKYRGMIGRLLYLTASWPNIMFSVCLCARFQEDPKTSHLESIKRIFRYIKETTHFGLCYPKEMGVETIVYVDPNHAGDYVDRKSTSGAIDLSKNPVLHSRTKHIEIRHHFLRDNVQKGNISIEKVSFEDNIADLLTKPLKQELFNLLRLAHPFFDSVEDLPPRTTNPPPPQPLFDTIEHLANQPPPLPIMEPLLLPLSPHLPPLNANNAFPILTHEMFCKHFQCTQVIVNELREEMRYSQSKRELALN
ncbi:hypothetical protein Tco_1546227 [Tanacetum coccineum]